MSFSHDLPADSTILHRIVHNVQHINVRNYYVGLYPSLHRDTDHMQAGLCIYRYIDLQAYSE